MIELSLKYCKFWHSDYLQWLNYHWNIVNFDTECIWAPKMMCTHCQHSTEWRPTVQDSRVHLGQPISGRVIEFICICSTSVTNIGGKLSKLKLWTRIYIGINERRCTSRQNHLKMWSIYWVMSFKALDTAEHLLKRYQWKAIVRLQHAWLVWCLNEHRLNYA